MKSLISSTLIVPFFLVLATKTPGFAQSGTVSAEDVLRKTAQKLNGLKTLRYRYRRELNYFSEGIHHEMSGNCYLDFSSADPVLGIRFQFNNSDVLTIFNGTEQFQCNRKNQTLELTIKPNRANFESLSFFYNAPITFRSALPMILADASIPKTVSDTLVNTTPFYAVTFALKQKALGYLGGYRPLTLERSIRYRLLIDKATDLPVEVIESNSSNQDFTKVSFQYTDATDSPADSSWYYSSYLNDYKLVKPGDEKIQLVQANQPAPDWTLPVFDASEVATLTQFKGKVVLLDFWIRNCGYCVASVPKLNALFKQYKGKDFALLGINPHDSKEVMAVFKQKIQPIYPLLYDAQNVAKRYGVGVFPVVVLIDKTGKVIYSGEFVPDKLSKLIEESI